MALTKKQKEKFAELQGYPDKVPNPNYDPREDGSEREISNQQTKEEFTNDFISRKEAAIEDEIKNVIYHDEEMAVIEQFRKDNPRM